MSEIYKMEDGEISFKGRVYIFEPIEHRITLNERTNYLRDNKLLRKDKNSDKIHPIDKPLTVNFKMYGRRNVPIDSLREFTLDISLQEARMLSKELNDFIAHYTDKFKDWKDL